MRRAKSLPQLSTSIENEEITVFLKSTRRSLNFLCVNEAPPEDSVGTVEFILSSFWETARCANCGRKILFKMKPSLEMNNRSFCSLDCYSTKMLQDEELFVQ
ncbi:hypothetical protein Gasu2_05520 [Galdieria sulphuraria]|uniref:FLZ-type domain-containing protein n=1 Tax=Galdieria sulphuraria TaxID=130081 RepID=M2Y967_GALSU|nr:uncharacterized protein Gasu_04720 [Galdieria sulphuraria]EME32384.1 hypothetical protein Gasu_04720 [Galdieria sulphuraria]GJD06120.1 hypothetical protein Gasu2_05520 [Galdieria sulphuraria]|eukprot:XP_005708904.1 hypothetical protein Gasu_04720 [Galdieria sulphuraria]